MEPLGDRLLLRPVAVPQKLGLLWLPPQATESFSICQAEIVARGAAVEDWRLQPEVRVIVRRFGRAQLDEETWVVREENVLAILRSLLPAADAQPSRHGARRSLQSVQRAE